MGPCCLCSTSSSLCWWICECNDLVIICSALSCCSFNLLCSWTGNNCLSLRYSINSKKSKAIISMGWGNEGTVRLINFPLIMNPFKFWWVPRPQQIKSSSGSHGVKIKSTRVEIVRFSHVSVPFSNFSPGYSHWCISACTCIAELIFNEVEP